METIPYDHWFTPEDLIDLTNRVGEELAAASAPNAASYREAFIAARFAAHRGAEKVRLIGETAHHTPDFAILVDDRELCLKIPRPMTPPATAIRTTRPPAACS
jgi:hypothetical protein